MRKTIIILFLILTGLTSAQAQLATKGVVDLRNCELVNDGVIDLSGEWQFCGGEHYSSSQMNQIISKVYLKIPSSWTSISKNNKSLSAFGIGTYAINIILSKNKKTRSNQLGFSIGNIVTAYKLWVNDELVIQAGNPTKTQKGFEAIYLPQSCFFQTESDTLKVVLQVTNFYDPIYAGLWQKIYFGTRSNIVHFDWKKTAFTLFIFNVLLLLFIYQLTLSFVQKSDKSHIVITLLALVSMTKMLCDAPISIYNFIPQLDIAIFYRVWFFSFFIIYLIFRLTKITYPSEVNKFVLKWFNWFYLISAIAFLTIDITTILTYISNS